MKPRNKSPLSTRKGQSKINTENGHQKIPWRRIGLRLAAIFLVIVFLASECATLLPVDLALITR